LPPDSLWSAPIITFSFEFWQHLVSNFGGLTAGYSRSQNIIRCCGNIIEVYATGAAPAKLGSLRDAQIACACAKKVDPISGTKFAAPRFIVGAVASNLTPSIAEVTVATNFFTEVGHEDSEV
jgi:hypothetical protein